MAQAQYDKFVELRKSWVDAKEARLQAYWETPVAPIATPVQTPTPTVATTPVVTPAPVAPVALENPIEKAPVAPTVTNPANNILPEVKPTPTPVSTPKTEAPIDFNASAWRETQIQDNVTKLTQTNPALLKDRVAYNQAFGYDTADQGKKAILDSQFTASQPAQPTASSMYNAIANKMEIPLEQQSSGAYRVANNRFQRANTYASMTPSQVSQAMNDTKLIEWSQTWEDMKAINPKLAQDAQNLRTVNWNKSNIFTYVNNPDWTPVKVNNLEKQFTEQYSEDHPDIVEQLKKIYATPSYDEMISKINTPEVKSIQDKASSIEWELNTLKTAMESVSKDVETELAWSGATGSRIALEKASRWEALQKQYDAKLRDYTTQYNKANDLINRNTEIYKYSQEQNKAMQSALAWVATEQYKNKLALENNQAEFEQKIAQQAQLAKDPTSAIWGIIKQFADLWIVWDRDLTWHLAEQERLGMSLPDYTKKMIEDFKAKPEYQQALAKKANEWVSFQTIGDKVYKVQNGQLIDTGIATAKTPDWKQDTSGNWYNANSATSPVVQTSTLSPTSISQISTRLQGNNVQCGMVSNDYAAVKFPDAPRMWDTYESKINTINAIWKAPIPQVWGLFVMDTWTSTGHTGIVTAVNGDGTFTATDANKSGSKDGWPLQTSTYKISDKVSFSNAPVWTQVPQGFTDSDIAVLGSVAKLDKQGKQTLNENWLTERDWANFNAWLLPPTAKQKQESQVVVDRIDDILKWDWTDAVWPFLWKSRVFTWGGTDRKVTELKVAALKDLLAMANLDKIKWAMSDKDIEFLRNTATYLSTDLSESEFEKTLNEIKTKYSNIAWGKPTTWTTQTNTGAWQTDPLWIL